MTSDTRPSDPRVLQEAAQWFAVLQFGDAREENRKRWSEWLGVPGSAQRAAWERVEVLSERFGAAAVLPGRQVLHAPRVSRRGALGTLAVLGAVTGTAWMASRSEGWHVLQADRRTGIGEIRETTLADGTRLWLNTDSAIDVQFGSAERRVRLLRGEVRIVTAHAATDPRPFLLDTAYGRLRPLGTRFTVRQEPDGALLSVDEGAVEVRPVPAGAPARVVAAGLQARFSAQGVAAPQPIRGLPQGWASGLLVADNLRLDAFLNELGRYRRGRLACDPAVADLRVAGVYSVRDTDHALDALAQALPVRVRRYAPWWVSVVPA